MKSTKLILLMGMVLLGTSCSKLKQVTLDKTVTVSFDVDLQEGDPLQLDLMQLVEFATGNLADYADAIKSYEVRDIRFKIWEFWTDGSAPDAMLDGSIRIGSKTGASPGVNYALHIPSLLEASENPDYTKFNFNSSEIKKIEQYLLSTNGLKIWLDGAVSRVPVHFRLQIVADVTAVAEK